MPRWSRALSIAMLAMVLAACAHDDEGDPRLADDPGPIHVHGLGINPSDGALFVATHSGLFRVDADGGEARRIGPLLQDTMGFTVVAPDRFLGSGHPDLEEMREDDLPPQLGLIESEDAGETWNRRSLLGEADFHALRAEGSTVVGYDSSHDRILVSQDGGASWLERPSPEPLLVDLVIRPGTPSELLASGPTTLHASSDGGATWQAVTSPPGLLSWPTADALVRVDAAGEVTRSADGGRTWSATGRVPGEPAALLAVGSDDVYVALHDGQIVRSQDGGSTFAVFSSPE